MWTNKKELDNNINQLDRKSKDIILDGIEYLNHLNGTPLQNIASCVELIGSDLITEEELKESIRKSLEQLNNNIKTLTDLFQN